MELPHAEKLYRELKAEGFGLVTVTADPLTDVRRLVDYNGITHPMVSDHDSPAGDKVYEKYHAYDGKHYVIGSDGTILAAFSKLGVSIPILKRELEKYGIGSQGPVRWQASATPAEAKRGGRVSVKLSASIDDGWHIYALTQGRGGPEPLAIRLAERQPFTLAGSVTSPAPSVKFDQNFGADVAEHEGNTAFVVPVAVASNAPIGAQTLTVTARYQACDSHICLPPQTAELRMGVNIASRLPHP